MLFDFKMLRPAKEFLLFNSLDLHWTSVYMDRTLYLTSCLLGSASDHCWAHSIWRQSFITADGRKMLPYFGQKLRFFWNFTLKERMNRGLSIELIFIIPYLVLSRVILSYLISSYITICLLLSLYLALSYLISPYLVLSHLSSPYLTISHLITPYLTLPPLISSYLALSHLIPSYLTLAHLISPYLALSHLI